MKNPQYPTTKFCLLTTQRSGSTWLNELLGSHPEVKLFSGEIFLDRPSTNNIGWIDDPDFMTFYDYRNKLKLGRPWTTFNYLDEIDDYPGDHKAIGFHLMYNQLADYPEILFRLIVDGYKIVHLERQNYLDTLISMANMNRRNIVHSRNNMDISAIHLDIDVLWKSLCRQEEKIAIVKRLIRFLPIKSFKVTYESLRCDRENQLHDIAQFLGVSARDIKFQSSLKKISQGSYSKKIKNFEQVRQKLLGTRFEEFIGG